MSTNSNQTYKHSASIPELNDADFISFLYAERDRENNLNQFHGWNNWALIGSLITVLCVIYSLLKDNDTLCIRTMLHSTSGVISIYLYLKAGLMFFKRERGYNYSRVRIIKDETPWADIGLVCVFAIIFISISLALSELGLIFWTWSIILGLYLIAITISIFNRDAILPSKYDNVFLPNFKMYVAFVSIVGGGWSVIICHTIITISTQILTNSFEIGCCIAAGLVIINLLIQINTSNKVVNSFDAIIDGYVYEGRSKAATYQAVLSNRMGYSVIEVCQKELKFIGDTLSKYDEIKNELDKVIIEIKEGSYNYVDLRRYNKLNLDSINLLQTALVISKKLTRRLKRILEITGCENIHEIEQISNLNDRFYTRIIVLINSVDEITALIDGEITKYYCNKYGGLCSKDCKHRNERLSYWYKVKLFFMSLCRSVR